MYYIGQSVLYFKDQTDRYKEPAMILEILSGGGVKLKVFREGQDISLSPIYERGCEKVERNQRLARNGTFVVSKRDRLGDLIETLVGDDEEEWTVEDLIASIEEKDARIAELEKEVASLKQAGKKPAATRNGSKTGDKKPTAAAS